MTSDKIGRGSPISTTVADPPLVRPSTDSDRATLRRRAALRLALGRYLGELRHRPMLAAVALFGPALGNISLNYLPPLVVADLVARIASGATITPGLMVPHVAAFAGALLAGEALLRVAIHCINRFESGGMARLYVAGVEELLAKDAAFFHENFAGALTKRVLGFATQFENFFDVLAFRIVASALPLVFASVVLWQFDPLLVAVMLGMIVLSTAAVLPLVRRRQLLVQAREAAWTRMSGRVADILSNMDAVRAHAAERREAAEHALRVDEHRRLTLASWDYNNLRIDTIVAPLSVLTNVVGLVLALVVATRDGGPGIAAVIVTFAYLVQATSILFEFNSIWRQMERSVTEAGQFTELLLDEPTVVDPVAPEPRPERASEVRLERVRFTHPGQGAPLFDGLDLRIGDGERVGLVGRSGGGKTSIIRLLLRLMDVDAGRILIGGRDITRLTQADLRSLIAYVPQDPVMFHRTLGENVAFGRPAATKAQVRAAAAAAHVLEFADALPQGFDTLVGERGVKLSGGQRQRVAIARALLRDAPVLLLDEATSALDSESEAHIQEALWRMMEGRTAIVVAHRLSTVAGMDRLVVLDRGRVVEQGSHVELLARGGGYAQLWQRQSGGFLGE